MTTMKLRWKNGDQVRLDADMETHLGRLHMNDPGTIVRLELGRRILVHFAVGDVWVDQDRLLPAQHSILEEMNE